MKPPHGPSIGGIKFPKMKHAAIITAVFPEGDAAHFRVQSPRPITAEILKQQISVMLEANYADRGTAIVVITPNLTPASSQELWDSLEGDRLPPDQIDAIVKAGRKQGMDIKNLSNVDQAQNLN